MIRNIPSNFLSKPSPTMKAIWFYFLAFEQIKFTIVSSRTCFSLLRRFETTFLEIYHPKQPIFCDFWNQKGNIDPATRLFKTTARWDLVEFTHLRKNVYDDQQKQKKNVINECFKARSSSWLVILFEESANTFRVRFLAIDLRYENDEWSNSIIFYLYNQPELLSWNKPNFLMET